MRFIKFPKPSKNVPRNYTSGLVLENLIAYCLRLLINNFLRTKIQLIRHKCRGICLCFTLTLWSHVSFLQ